MIGIYINGEFLDLYPDSKLTFVKENNIYTTGDPTILSDPYSFPMDVPLTDHNRRLLQYPDLIQNYTPLLSEEQVFIYCGEGQSMGIPLFFGSLYVKNSWPDKCSIFIVVDSISKYKDLKFGDIDFGSHTEADGAALRDVAKDTTTSPGDYDFVFFPYINKSFNPSDATLVYNNPSTIVVNWYDPFTAHFVEDYGDDAVTFPFVTPFLKVKLVLQKIVEHMGYSMVNELMDDNDELKLMMLYSNYHILDRGNWPDTIDYNDHVPSTMNVMEALKEIASIFCCGIFLDNVNKTVQIIPLRNVLNQAHAKDWTLKAENKYTQNLENSLPKYITYANYQGNEWVRVYAENTFPEFSGGVSEPSTPGAYYYLRDNTYRRFDNSLPASIIKKKLARFFTRMNIERGTAEPKEFSAAPMYQEEFFPNVDYPLSGYFVTINADDEKEADNITSELSQIRFTLYRGMRNTVVYGNQPIATFNAFDIGSSAIAFEHSLDWSGENGLYEKYWKEWLHFMEYKKNVQRTFNLTLADIVNFKEWNKIRVEGSMYFVKSMRITIGTNGIEPTQVELVSIPAT